MTNLKVDFRITQAKLRFYFSNSTTISGFLNASLCFTSCDYWAFGFSRTISAGYTCYELFFASTVYPEFLVVRWKASFSFTFPSFVKILFLSTFFLCTSSIGIKIEEIQAFVLNTLTVPAYIMLRLTAADFLFACTLNRVKVECFFTTGSFAFSCIF